MGGLIFMVNDKMCVGVDTDRQTGEDRLMVRVGKAAWAVMMDRPGCREMDFAGKPMKEFLDSSTRRALIGIPSLVCFFWAAALQRRAFLHRFEGMMLRLQVVKVMFLFPFYGCLCKLGEKFVLFSPDIEI